MLLTGWEVILDELRRPLVDIVDSGEKGNIWE